MTIYPARWVTLSSIFRCTSRCSKRHLLSPLCSSGWGCGWNRRSCQLDAAPAAPVQASANRCQCVRRAHAHGMGLRLVTALRADPSAPEKPAWSRRCKSIAMKEPLIAVQTDNRHAGGGSAAGRPYPGARTRFEATPGPGGYPARGHAGRTRAFLPLCAKNSRRSELTLTGWRRFPPDDIARAAPWLPSAPEGTPDANNAALGRNPTDWRGYALNLSNV